MVPLQDETLREQLPNLHPRWRPTAIESFLQCPFQFFSRYTLRLSGVPPPPESRLDPLAQGNLVHNALAEWHRTRESMEALFQRLFEDFCRVKRVREGYASELARMEMLRNLLALLENPRLQPEWRTEVEQPFQVELEAGVTVSGRIDRYDVSPDGSARLYDYKYSGAIGLARRFQPEEAGRFVQGGLYLLALAPRFHVASFHYCGLKGGVRWRGWEGPVEILELTEQARSLTIEAVHRIAAGDVAVRPWSADACRYCDYRDVCRVKAIPAVRIAGAVE
jgi:ATP-dependent helicase/DNAse subunit B